MNADHKLLGTDRDKIARLQTPATRPVACDLDAARQLARQLAGTTSTGTVAWDAALAIRALAADLAATRAERDAARAGIVQLEAAHRGAMALYAEAEAERDAALGEARDDRAQLTHADKMIATLKRECNGLRIDRQTPSTELARVTTPTPAADAPDLPPFLAARVNGGAG